MIEGSLDDDAVSYTLGRVLSFQAMAGELFGLCVTVDFGSIEI